MKVIQDKDNFLINRKEVKVIVEQDSTPDYKKAKEIIKEKFNGSEEAIAIKKVKGKFGRNTFLISAFIYNSKEDKDNFEKKKKKEEEKKEGEEEKVEENKEEDKKDKPKEKEESQDKEEKKEDKSQDKEEKKEDKKEESQKKEGE